MFLTTYNYFSSSVSLPADWENVSKCTTSLVIFLKSVREVFEIQMRQKKCIELSKMFSSDSAHGMCVHLEQQSHFTQKVYSSTIFPRPHTTHLPVIFIDCLRNLSKYLELVFDCNGSTTENVDDMQLTIISM